MIAPDEKSYFVDWKHDVRFPVIWCALYSNHYYSFEECKAEIIEKFTDDWIIWHGYNDQRKLERARALRETDARPVTEHPQ